MFEKLLDVLRVWNGRTSERQKLQQAYLILIVLLTLIAGFVSLANDRLAHQFMVVVLAAMIAFAANAIVWHLLNSALLLKFKPADRPRSPRRP